MNAEVEQLTFRGNPVSLFVKSMLNAALFLLILSYCLFEWYGLRIYIAALILLVPVMILIVSQNRFAFDDHAKTIKKPMQNPIPYSAIRSISLYESGAGITLLAATGALRKRILVESLQKGDKERVLNELAERFHDIPIRSGGMSLGKIILGVELGILIVCLLANGYIYKKYPQVKTVPTVSTVEIPKFTDYRLDKYAVSSISFRLPDTFKFFTNLSNGYIFKHMKKTAKIRVVSGMYDHVLGRNKELLEKVSGLKGIFEFYNMGYYARFGVVPLMLKVMMIGKTQEPVIFRIENDTYRGFVLEGVRDGQHFAHILVETKDRTDDVHFIIYNDNPGNGKIVEQLLRYIRPQVKNGS